MAADDQSVSFTNDHSNAGYTDMNGARNSGNLLSQADAFRVNKRSGSKNLTNLDGSDVSPADSYHSLGINGGIDVEGAFEEATRSFKYFASQGILEDSMADDLHPQSGDHLLTPAKNSQNLAPFQQ